VASTRLQSLIRSAEPESLDLFLVAAVLTVLTLRVYLKATNYPQIGGGGLQIAHVLWGGLGMVVAIAIRLPPRLHRQPTPAIPRGAGRCFRTKLKKLVDLWAAESG